MPSEDFPTDNQGHTASQLISVCVTVGVLVALRNNFVPTNLVVADLATTLLLAAVIRFVVHQSSERLTEAQLGIVAACLVAFPFLLERISRAVFFAGLPLEATTMCALRNLALLPIVVPHDRRGHSFGVAASLLTIMTVYLQDVSLSTSIIVFSYCVLGIFWLIGWHWTRFQLKAPSHSQRQIPGSVKLGVAGVTIACSMIAVITMRGAAMTTAIAGFMPSSGGDRRSDPFAFGGVGDGDQMVGATDSAKSIGPIESELFLESKMPSIYDVFNDLYLEPGERPKKTSRAIPLSPNEFTENHNRLAKTDVASREFAAVRRQSKREAPQELSDIRSNALFYVKGRVPLHLKQEAYDSWDGWALSYRGNSSQHELELDASKPVPWVRCNNLSHAEDFSTVDIHAIRIARLKTDRIPSPPGLCAISLDKLHTARLFSWTNDGVLRFADRTIPQMTVLHVQSVVRRKEVVESSRFIRDKPPRHSNLSAEVRQYLQAWTSEATNDWDCVESIVAGIQQTCELDPTASVEESDGDVVNEFLLSQRRGPDYLFAIATARLLRELGFRTNVLSGFYARPENYDRESGQTAVYPEDVHFWLETQSQDGSWFTVEPSPGYEVSYAPPSLRQRLERLLRNTAAIIGANPLAFCGGMVSVVLITMNRRRIYVATLLGWWLLPLPRTDRTTVRCAFTVVAAHMRLRGYRRRPETTVATWLQFVAQDFGEVDVTSIVEFRRLVQWAMYAGSDSPPTSTSPRQTCRAFISNSLHRCNQTKNQKGRTTL